MHTSTAGNNICINSGAGVYVNKNGEDIIGIQSRVYIPDMRKLVANHRSPKFTINMDKTLTVVGGKKEHFGSISDMIFHWEGMESKEEEGRGGGRRRKRKGVSQ